ncbi:MAG TPA: hypothetical protein VKZ78_04825 [Sphingobacteriaceae bacterium]|nr:hypothetical protein [Sphingobacteriaceae bacterium]
MHKAEKKAEKVVFLQKVDPDEYHDENLAHDGETEENSVKRDTTKIYFFILAIVALLATNVYFYIKYQTSEEQAYGISTEMAYMQDEIDRIEAEVNRLSSENLALNQSLKISEDSVRFLIASLREKLSEQNLTRMDLMAAQQEIDHLREEVVRYRDELTLVTYQNSQLLSENENLQREVSEKEAQLGELQLENMDLTDQIRSAAVLKLSNINVMGIRERKGNREDVDDKSRRVDRFRIVFTIADNPLIESGEVDIYMRVIDPNGNLKTKENQTFELSGNPMQYTDKSIITFTNQGESYTMEWLDPQGFKKGTYTIVLYTDNSTMGRGSIVLN